MLTKLVPLLASLAAVDASAFINRLRRNVIIYALVLLFALTTYGTLVAAATVMIARSLGVVGALLAVAGSAAFLALFLYLVMRGVTRADERRKREAVATSGSKALMVTAALSALPVLVRSRPLVLIAVAGGLGYLAMRSLGVDATASDMDNDGASS